MAVFPDIDMSIGEYYKMLMEGKRPTRRAAPKEEIKPPAQIPPKPKKIEKIVTQLKEKGAQIPQQSEEKGAKRKDKALEKLKMKTSKSNKVQVEEEKEKPPKPSSLPKEESRLRQSTSNQTSQLKMIKGFKPEKRKKISDSADEAVNEDSDDQFKQMKSHRLHEDYEFLEPYPKFSIGRFFILKGNGSRPILKLIEIEGETYTGLDSENQKVEALYRDINFLGKPRLCSISLIEEPSPELLSAYDLEDQHLAAKSQTQIVVFQSVPSEDFSGKNEPEISFLSLLPGPEFQVAPASLKETADIDTDLKEFSQEALKNQELKHLDFLINQTVAIKDQCDRYLSSVKKIILTRQNMVELLFSICSYEMSSDPLGEAKSSKFKQGILLQVKFDKHHNDFMLLMRLLNVKHAYKKKVEWLELSKFQIMADLSHGFISLSHIQTFQNTIGANQKLKAKTLLTVSFRQSQIERKSIRVTSEVSAEEGFRTDILIQGHDSERCNVCNYITKDIEHVKCGNCSKVYHQQCLSQKWNVGLSVREAQWRCHECIRCTNCLSIKNNSQLYICSHCNSAHHEECLDVSSKLSLPNQPDKDSPSRLGKSKSNKNLSLCEFKCDRCVKCEHCGVTEAGPSRLNKWSRDFKLCSNCNKKRKHKQYCLVCEKFWPDQALEATEQLQTADVQPNQYLQTQMVYCGDCQMWTHLECDRIFQDASLKAKFDSKQLCYSCSDCRFKRRKEIIKQLIEKVASEDKFFFFQEPVENSVENYKKIVKVPMCFKYMREKADSSNAYLMNPEQLKQDVQLIFQNAILFNLPKHRVHREAQKIMEASMQHISNVFSSLEHQKLRQLDEDAFKEFLQSYKTGKQLENSPKFNLSPDQLFDPLEHQQHKSFPEEQEDQLEGERDEDGDVQMAAAVNLKNLRQRKHINYNEDKGIGGDLLKSKGDVDLKAKRRFDEPYLSRPNPLETLLQASHSVPLPPSTTNAIEPEAPSNHIAQQQQMMMNYYEGIDDEKCYYSNPSRCSFDNPALMFEEMCYLCGAFGNREDFLCCNLCGESFHTYCLSLPHDNIAKFQSYWKCLNCKYCEICSQATQEAQLLYCDICDKAFHSFCLKPKLKSIPNCQWKCQECFKCQKCGTKAFFSEEDALQLKNMEVTDFKFSANFSFCYKCGLNEYKKSFCKLCSQKNDEESGMNIEKMELCTTCGYYSHLRCSRLLPDDSPEDCQDYKCLECLLSGKTINHLIRETCEHYENLHQIISRQRLLSAICQESLSKYFPIPEKAPLFIKIFIDQSQAFFREDPIMQEWLALLETNVCFEQTEASDGIEAQDEEVDEEGQVSKAEPKKIEQAKTSSVVKRQLTRDWSDFHADRVFEEKAVSLQKDPEILRIEQELFAHKTSFLPKKRVLYKSLKENNFHRFAQRDKIITPAEMKEFLTVPTDDVLSKIDFAEEYVKVEFKGVMRLKCQFFQWFEEMIKNILKKNQKFVKREKKQSSSRHSEDSQNLMIQQPADAQEDQSRDVQMQDAEEGEPDGFMMLEDIALENPQNKLQCIMCRQWGELKVTGRLIPFQVNQFVHVNCALWSTEVFETDDGQLVNFHFIQSQRSKKCNVCLESGASILCFGRKCHSAFHFPCAYRSGKVAFMRSKETFCEVCAKQKGIIPGYLYEFNVPRRLYIVRNQQPWNMNSNGQQNAAPQQNSSGPDGDKPFTIEKWRPFYYDMFNRVGNLTVLSLKQNVNQIIEELSQTGTKIINQDQSSLSDFATLRIYWKFFSDSEMKIEDENVGQPSNLKKGFFIYFNNQIREVIKGDVHSLIPLLGDKLRERLNQLMLKSQPPKVQPITSVQLIEPINSTSKLLSCADCDADFWQKIISHFQKVKPNFSLQNIEFSIFEFTGKTKYPVSIWNRAETKNKHFFLKSGAQVLASQAFQERESSSQANQAQTEGQLTINDVFRRMARINQAGDFKNPNGNNLKSSVSSKHMKYATMLKILGKKMFYQKTDDTQKKVKSDNKPNKNLRTTESVDSSNKEIDLPIAMKYRMSKAQPKRVEVGPSKIHRNGLFTLEDLMMGDIVIEYVGEKIRNSIADRREIVYEQKGIGDCYLFRLDKEYIIDATFFGNKARYLNHSCDANCSAKIITVQGQQHIIISSNRVIKSGEELTYNYNFDVEADKLDCFCGSQNCLGRLN